MTKLTISNNNLAPEWYQMLIEDCQAIIVESGYTARWVLIEGYHSLGERISQDIDKDPDLVTRVAESLDKSTRTIQRAVQFYNKFAVLDTYTFPEGKNVSWHSICNKYLPISKNAKETNNEEEKQNALHAGGVINECERSFSIDISPVIYYTYLIPNVLNIFQE